MRYPYVSVTWACPKKVERIGIRRCASSPLRYQFNRFHGSAPAARGKNTFGPRNSLGRQSRSWLFQLLPVHITDADKLAASDSKTFDFHFAEGPDRS